MAVAAWLVFAVLGGAWVYCILVAAAARHYRRVTDASGGADSIALPGISVLKPLAGAEEALAENLASFFDQAYPKFEILLAVREAHDPASSVVREMQRRFPHVQSQLLVTGEPPYPNAKVFSLDTMLQAAQYDLIVMADSDVRVTSQMLRTIAMEFEDTGVGLTTCPYRAIGTSLSTELEALGMNTEFIGGVLVARMLEGMRFALGPTITARRKVIEALGGFQELQAYLAEDFVMGQRAADRGWRVLLSQYVIEHRIGAAGWRHNAAHRLRWARSTRRSRPAGYVGQLFTNPLPIALVLVALAPGWWPALMMTLVVRAWAAWVTAGLILHAPLHGRFWLLLPVQDLLSAGFWAAGFFGDTIQWRGRRYRLLRDGRFEPC